MINKNKKALESRVAMENC